MTSKPQKELLPSVHSETPAWHALTATEMEQHLHTNLSSGLSSPEIQQRQIQYGSNQLTEVRRVTFWSITLEEITEPMILLLLVVGVAYGLLGNVQDGLAIFCIIIGIASVEIYNEFRAKRAIVALQHLAPPIAMVVRGGQYLHVPVETLVPGDTVRLERGERVPADLRLIDAVALRIDESSLTGESIAVAKSIQPVLTSTLLADRTNMAYASSLVVAGKGLGVVVAIGMATEIGRIAGLVRLAREPKTPLQLAMRQLAGTLVWVAVGMSILVPIIGLLFGQPWRLMILTGLTLAFATIPEELPILITSVLGLGALRLTRQHAIIKRLRAAETLGSVSVIATDKTGTLTENRMTVAELFLPGNANGCTVIDAAQVAHGRLLLEIGVLANDAVPTSSHNIGSFLGDPTDTALLTAAVTAGMDPQQLRGQGPANEQPFDEDRKLVSTLYQREDNWLIGVKGAPDAILLRSSAIQEQAGIGPLTEDRKQALRSVVDQMADRGYRVLACAMKRLPATDPPPGQESMESDLTVVGLIGLLDPPRVDVPSALATLQSAGIRVLMLTGDHLATAQAVAQSIGINTDIVITGHDLDTMSESDLTNTIATTDVYARITPEHKLRIVRALQQRGEVVAVTGDGVNDAPALKEAAIGIAMGETGTDVAKEAADMILADDNFAVIGVAVREGRKLYANLQKAVRYYLAVKMALVGSALLAVLAHLPVPFAPIQIIITELFMDLAASVAFTTEPAEGDVMLQAPRDPRHPFMDRIMLIGIMGGGASLCAAVLGAYVWAILQGAAPIQAQTVAFVTWMIGHVILAFHMRSQRQPLLTHLFNNPAMILWGAAAVVVAIVATSVPVVSHVLKTVPLSADEWSLVVGLPMVTTLWLELQKLRSWKWPGNSRTGE